jgi:ring-1,2-phenylacetyl-CoA epoxidase subunit PaaD
VVDPEIRAVTIEELGILRDVTVDDAGHVVVTITPTYSGCPALDLIRTDITAALTAAGFGDAEVRITLTPPWSTDQISPTGREKLAGQGIAPPGMVTLRLSPRCPACGSPDTEQLSRFGSTACKSLWRCRTCAEPFDAVKPL